MRRKTRKNVGIIGLGLIGSRVATALRSARFHVYVWNRSPRAEPNFLGSAGEVADACDVVQLFVPDAAAVFETIESFAGHIGERHTVICSATVGPEATLEAARRVTASGARFLDAPFTGSKIAAEKKELVYYVGGDDETFENVSEILKASSKSIVKIGPVGHAAALKVATNMMAAVSVQSLAEALAVSRKSGIPDETFVKALEQHGVRSGLIDLKLPGMISDNFEPHFTMRHMFKDMQLAIQMANAMSLEIPTTSTTAGLIYGAINRGWNDLDYSALVKVYEHENAVAREEPEPVPEPVPEKIEEPVAAASPEKENEPVPENSEEIVPKRRGLFGWRGSARRE